MKMLKIGQTPKPGVAYGESPELTALNALNAKLAAEAFDVLLVKESHAYKTLRRAAKAEAKGKLDIAAALLNRAVAYTQEINSALAA